MINNGRSERALRRIRDKDESRLIRKTDFLGYIIGETEGEDYAEEKGYRKAIVNGIGTPKQQALYAILLLRSWVHVQVDAIGTINTGRDDPSRLEMMDDIFKGTQMIYDLGKSYPMNSLEVMEAIDLAEYNMTGDN